MAIVNTEIKPQQYTKTVKTDELRSLITHYRERVNLMAWHTWEAESAIIVGVKADWVDLHSWVVVLTVKEFNPGPMSDIEKNINAHVYGRMLFPEGFTLIEDDTDD